MRSWILPILLAAAEAEGTPVSPRPWLRQYLPEALWSPAPGDLLWWQWLALVLLLAVAWVGGRLLGMATQSFLRRVSSRTRAEWDDALIARLSGPLWLTWTLGLSYLLVSWLRLHPPAGASVRAVIDAGVVVTVFWALWRSVDVVGGVLSASAWGRHPSGQSLLSLGVRIGKVAVFAMGSIAALAQLGYPVASLLAGLGLGGLALALAAQKTVEHLFGSFALAVDQPFHVGDLVKVEDVVGNVETIGLRSTRIRTLDRTLITVPNGKLADLRIESYAARDRIRLACSVSLVYGTTAAQMREVLEGLERVLRSHPKVWPDAVVVRFKELGASALEIEVMAWFQTVDSSEFQLIRQDVLLQFMEVVERAGTRFAYPTRTLHVVGSPAAPPQPAPAPRD